VINKVSTRIQSRLSRKDIKVTLGEIKAVYNQMVADINKPTELEIDSITEHFMNQFSKPVAPEQSQEIEPLETVQNHNVINTSSEVQQQAITPPEDNQIVVSDAEKQSLIATQSIALGFNLTEEETIAVADSIDDVFTDYSSFISSVTNTIKGYIAHKFNTIENDLQNSTTEVREYLTIRTNQLNQKVSNFTNNIRAIQTDTEAIRKNLKTSENAVLSRFRLT
jgi:hypothetical protein